MQDKSKMKYIRVFDEHKVYEELTQLAKEGSS